MSMLLGTNHIIVCLQLYFLKQKPSRLRIAFHHLVSLFVTMEFLPPPNEAILIPSLSVYFPALLLCTLLLSTEDQNKSHLFASHRYKIIRKVNTILKNMRGRQVVCNSYIQTNNERKSLKMKR